MVLFTGMIWTILSKSETRISFMIFNMILIMISYEITHAMISKFLPMIS